MSLSDYRTALVTGASSGIGAAVVRALCANGLTVHAAARRTDRLDALAEATGSTAHAIDLRDRRAVYDALAGLQVDVLVNNAGLGRGFLAFYSVDPDDIDTTVETNVSAALHVLRAVTPGMVQRRRGHIVNVGSVAGLYPINSAIYGASKGAVHLMSQNLRIELSGTGVRVTEICPGRVRTEFFETAVDDPEVRRGLFKGFQPLESEDIAAAITYALDAPWHVNVGMIELTPTEQHLGGITTAPVTKE